jgi:translation initiation factor eIF-2B subunit delta
MKPNVRASIPKPSTSVDVNNTLANQVFRLALFDHLPRKQLPKDPDSVEGDRILHPATIQLGIMFGKGVITADDDRAHSLILTFCSIVRDYSTPPNKILREDLDRYIGKQVQFLVECRQLSKGMGNIIKFLKTCISKILPETSEADAKSEILSKLRGFIEERIEFAGESIAQYITSTINDGDVILTFGSSPLIRKVLLHAAKSKKRFRLTVIDSRPLHEGLQTLSALSPVVHCVYSPLSGAAVAMTDANKVILGASCLLSNGTMLAASGTAMVAALAKARQIPVIVASESYKFSDKVQLDSIVFNELGHPAEISLGGLEAGASATYEGGYKGSADKQSISALGGLAHNDNGADSHEHISIPQQWHSAGPTKLPFEVVNLRYDLTPLSNISVVATETGLIPPTSVPVLIRELQSEQGSRSA